MSGNPVFGTLVLPEDDLAFEAQGAAGAEDSAVSVGHMAERIRTFAEFGGAFGAPVYLGVVIRCKGPIGKK